MYKPYVSDSETENDTESETGSEASSDNDSTRHQYDERLLQMDEWRRKALQWVPAPGRTVPTHPLRQDTGLGLYNTELRFAEKRRVSVLMVDSLDRDPAAYPLPTAFRLQLPRVYRNVEKIEIVQLKFMSALYSFSETQGNTSFTLTDATNGTRTVSIPAGNYSLGELMSAIYADLPADYKIEYNHNTGRITILNTSPITFSLNFYSSLPASKQKLTSNWGLGWNLGFGGAPVDLSGATTYTATALPRMFSDYIFLRMNDGEHVNTVDHTGPETLSVAQESWGQVADYFGKLLLNNFGCYAQTFVEAPKEFRPVLGRMDRLSLEWLDRAGAGLTAEQGAAACDWHATFRITEVVETPAATSSLVLAPPRNSRRGNSSRSDTSSDSEDDK